MNAENIGWGPAIRMVMKHPKIRDRFNSIHPKLEKLGITGIEVTDEGFKFVKKNEGSIQSCFGTKTILAW